MYTSVLGITTDQWQQDLCSYRLDLCSTFAA